MTTGICLAIQGETCFFDNKREMKQRFGLTLYGRITENGKNDQNLVYMDFQLA